MDETITTKTPEIEVMPPQKSIRNERRKSAKVDDRHGAYLLLIEQGLEPMKAAQALGYHPRTAYDLNKKLNAYEKKRDALLKTATSTLSKFAAGKDVNGIRPKCSTVMSATNAILDREVPIVRHNVNVNANLDFLPFDLGELKG